MLTTSELPQRFRSLPENSYVTFYVVSHAQGSETPSTQVWKLARAANDLWYTFLKLSDKSWKRLDCPLRKLLRALDNGYQIYSQTRYLIQRQRLITPPQIRSLAAIPSLYLITGSNMERVFKAKKSTLITTTIDLKQSDSIDQKIQRKYPRGWSRKHNRV